MLLYDVYYDEEGIVDRDVELPLGNLTGLRYAVGYGQYLIPHGKCWKSVTKETALARPSIKLED